MYVLLLSYSVITPVGLCQTQQWLTILRHVSVIFVRKENISISIWHAGYGGLQLPKYNKNKRINEWLSNSINIPLNAPKK